MNNTALITGASSGIGKELCIIHAEHGGDMVIVARRKDKLDEIKAKLEREHSVHVMVITKDLSGTGAPLEVYNEIKEAGIEIEYLINNAGFGGIGKFYEREMEKDMAMINLNILALTTLTRLFLPDFVKRGSGKVLNVSSTASLMPGPLQAVYYATKAYVTFFSNAIAEELCGTNVTVTNLMPGATETEFGQISGMDKTRLFEKTASSRKVAKDGYKGMLKGKMDVISGFPFVLKVMLKMVPFVPKKMLLKTVRKLQETE